MSKLNKFKFSKNVKYTTFSAISIAIVLAVILIFNIICGLLVDKFNIKFDFTSQGQFSLTEISKDYAKKIEIPVEVFVFMPKSSFEQNPSYSTVSQLLDEFESINKNIKVQYLDINKNPQFVSKYSDLALVEGDILFTSTIRNKKVNINKLVYGDTRDKGKNKIISEAESYLTSSFVAVTSTSQAEISFLIGHGEDEKTAETFISLLEKNNFIVSKQNIISEEINPNASYIVITGPVTDYSSDDLKKIDKFLTNDGNYGKNMLYFHSPVREVHPNLNSYFEEWGIKILPDFVYETNTKKYTSTDPMQCFLDFSEEEFSKDLIANNLTVISGPSCPLEVVFDKKSNIQTKKLLSFSPTAAKKSLAATNEGPLDTDEKDAYPALVLSEKTLYNTDSTAKKSSNVIVSGNFFVGKNQLQSASLGNADYIVRIFNGLIEKDDTLNIAPKTISTTQITINESQRTIVTIIFAFLIPLAVLIAGIVIWLKRKSL